MTDLEIPHFTRSDRIRELSSIDTDIPRLLQAAGLAVSSLTDRPLPRDTSNGDEPSLSQKLPKHILDNFDEPVGAPSESDSPSLAAHKAAFRDASASYYTLLQSISARLRRQVYALEEAGLISESVDKFAESSAAPAIPVPGLGGQAHVLHEDGRQTARVSAGIIGQQQEMEKEAPVTNGGLGNLDVGWLNSRGEGVEREKEAELVEEAKELLESILEKKRRNQEGDEENAMDGIEQG